MQVIWSSEIAAREPAHQNDSVSTTTDCLSHDVSIRPGVGRQLGSQPRANTSMTIMRAPHARTWARQNPRRIRGNIRLLLRVADRRSDPEKCASRCDVVGTIGAGEEPIVADAVEALGKDVHQEAPDELVWLKPHGFPAALAVDAIVLPAKRDAAVVGCDETAVRDGDAMGVTGEIAQHLLGSCERRLAVDHPLDVPQRGEEALERALVGEP